MVAAGVDQRAFREARYFVFGPGYDQYDQENPLDDKKLQELSSCFQLFPELEVLEFVGCKHVTDAGLLTLPKLPNLKWIQINGTNISEDGVSMLQQRFPSVEIRR